MGPQILPELVSGCDCLNFVRTQLIVLFEDVFLNKISRTLVLLRTWSSSFLARTVTWLESRAVDTKVEPAASISTIWMWNKEDRGDPPMLATPFSAQSWVVSVNIEDISRSCKKVKVKMLLRDDWLICWSSPAQRFLFPSSTLYFSDWRLWEPSDH
jgi:hypothetical protein